MAAAPTTMQVGACSNGFPPSFIWGLGTSAYQIEGGTNLTGRQPSIWDSFAHTPGKTSDGDTGDVACDHVRLFRTDVELMRSIGLRHYRFSISWSRVMSWDAARRRMVPNEPGLRFYDALLDALLAAGIAPYVTLYHWDLPQALHAERGAEGATVLLKAAHGIAEGGELTRCYAGCLKESAERFTACPLSQRREVLRSKGFLFAPPRKIR